MGRRSGSQLAAAGIHALAVDYRGFGESGGPRFDTLTPQDAQRAVTDKWPGDIDTAYAFLSAQPGVDKTRIGAAGGSCGVTQAVHVAQRHPEVRSLVLLAGPLDRAGLAFLERTPWLPIFAAGAADDQYDDNTPELMQWILAHLRQSAQHLLRFQGRQTRNRDLRSASGAREADCRVVRGHAREAARRSHARGDAEEHADARLLAEGRVSRRRRRRRRSCFTTNASAIRTRSCFPETALNLLGYQHLQDGQDQAAIELFKLNTEAYPTSANTYDSLGDAYLADGQNDLALQASQKAIEMLASDKSTDDRKQAIRASAEEKIAKLKGEL